jgi:hypothetical protein
MVRQLFQNVAIVVTNDERDARRREKYNVKRKYLSSKSNVTMVNSSQDVIMLDWIYGHWQGANHSFTCSQDLLQIQHSKERERNESDVNISN